MVNGSSIFQGEKQLDQVNKIFEIRGSLNERIYPDLSILPIWLENEFEVHEPKDLHSVCPRLDKNGIDLLDKMLKLNPEDRITTDEALNHPFFNDLADHVKNLYK